MKCLRCGREIEAGKTFCSECIPAVQVPLEDSPYLNTQVVLPVRTAQPAAKKPDTKKERKRRPWKCIILSCMLSLLCAALLLQCGYLTLEHRRDQASLASLQELTQEQARLSKALKDAEAEKQSLALQIEQAQAQEKSAQDALAAAQEQLVDQEQRLSFFAENIVFMQDDDTGYYHSYDCTEFLRSGYRVLSRTEAELQNYTPCPLCQ